MASRELPTKVWLPIFLAAAISGYLLIQNREAIKDWWFFRSYEAPSIIQSLSDAGMFTEEGERLFFRGAPEFIEPEEAGTLCLGVDNIGCLVTGPKIYLVDFEGQPDEESDLQLVTAAHEMLHLAYFRLSESERTEIDRLISLELAKPRHRELLDRLNEYGDPIVIADEGHAQLGSEAQELSPELEEHYAQYFRDRSVIADAHKNSKVLLGR